MKAPPGTSAEVTVDHPFIFLIRVKSLDQILPSWRQSALCSAVQTLRPVIRWPESRIHARNTRAATQSSSNAVTATIVRDAAISPGLTSNDTWLTTVRDPKLLVRPSICRTYSGIFLLLYHLLYFNVRLKRLTFPCICFLLLAIKQRILFTLQG